MGNLIIGGALLNGHCGINFENSVWVELQVRMALSDALGGRVVSAAPGSPRVGNGCVANPCPLSLRRQPAYPIARLAEFGRMYFCDVYQSDSSLMAMQLQEDMNLCQSVGLLNPSWESMVSTVMRTSTCPAVAHACIIDPACSTPHRRMRRQG